MHRFVRDRAFALFGAIVLAATVLDLLTIRRADPGPVEVSQRAPAPVVVPAPTPTRPQPAQPPPAPQRVVIVSEDGLRPDALSPELTPRHVALMREGTTAKQAETIPESDTLPSHASMLSGVGAAAHGLWWNSYQSARGFIHVPTIFSAAHARGLSTAMIV
ncbi:MAG TPA: alkaline phosphatase family protein, partial [Kofleriaceae bacterium]|nr:alkaline phosphatase family protein [Kofleriaceae bacterium]